MRFPPSFLDELRARLPVSEVVGRRVKLKKAGREWAGLSPFNNEKTPSFTVNDQKGFYHDFSSGKHGDIFGFVMETEGLPFAEAVEKLAAMAGLPMPRVSSDDVHREQRQKSLHDVMELAAKYFEQNLASSVGAAARGYLADRAISSASQIEFRMGYATAGRFALKEFLGSKGIPVADMIETGLLIAGDDIPVPYDRFRDRIIIPIHDQRGRVIAFGGRAMNNEVKPKYLNSPETALFHKGSIVFNFHRARQPAHESGSVVAVEGYMDAIAIYQAGIKGVVATMGTAFTEEQITTLWRLSSEPIVCFDSDRAGIAAAHKSLDRILPLIVVGKSFRFAFMQDEKDPDDFIRERGVEAFRGVLAVSQPLSDMLWARETSDVDVRTPDRQAKLERKLNALINSIKDPLIQSAYKRTFRLQLADLFWQAVKGKKSAFVRKETQPSPTDKSLTIAQDGERRVVQKVLLGILVHYPDFLDDKHDKITRITFSPDLDKFCTALYRLLVEQEQLSVQQIYDLLPSEFYDLLEDIHGKETSGRRWGHSLFLRYPILTFEPSRDFISRSIDHFAKVLYVDEMDRDIARLKIKAGESENNELAVDRLLEMIRQRQHEQTIIDSDGAILTDEAEQLRRVWSPQGGRFRLEAGIVLTH